MNLEKICRLALFVLILTFKSKVSSDTVVCKFEVIYWSHFGELNTCIIANKHIESPGIGLTVLTSIKAFKLIGNNNVKYLPEHIVETIPRIVAYEAKYTLVKTVERKHFQSLINLANIALGHNAIETIKVDAFEGCTRLQFLYLFHNNIKSLPANMLSPLPILKLIYLKSNNLFEIPKGFLNNNSKLERFEVRDNFIEWIDPDIFKNITCLKNVDLQGNRCIDGKYNKTSLRTLRTDLIENCSLSFEDCHEQRIFGSNTKGKQTETLSYKELMNENEELLKRMESQTKMIAKLMQQVTDLRDRLTQTSDEA